MRRFVRESQREREREKGRKGEREKGRKSALKMYDIYDRTFDPHMVWVDAMCTTYCSLAISRNRDWLKFVIVH